QGIFANFRNVLDTTRVKLPFGIAQIGKSFRNEVTTKAFTFRTREFEQAELEFFCEPGTDEQWYEHWKEFRFKWYTDLGIKKENLRFRDHQPDELAHYAKKAVDIEYEFPFGWQEIEGIHHRGNWDLTRHQQYSGHDYRYFDENTKEKFIPNVIETSVGLDRTFFVLFCNAYQEITGGRSKTTETNKKKEIVLRLSKQMSPIKIAVLPLAKKEKITKLAKKIFDSLLPHYVCQYDESSSIGRRYRRQDEIGTPYCLTIDFDSLTDKSATIRDRDTMKQERILIKEIIPYLQNKFNDEPS
ncbi:MAG: glycine--tRNA ligase, partial [Candidatus Aenigmarchaeota archaeon]|nr:glycine--tRNA ligase [Candidatus Aenigmarchaeota archaeon]